jgi:hypothetical protein
MKVGVARGALLGILVGGTFGLTLGTSFAASTASMSSSQAAMTSSCVQKPNHAAAPSAELSSDPKPNGIDRFLLLGGN